MNFYMFSNTLLNNFFVLRSLKDTSNCGDKANDSDLHLQEITHTYNLNILDHIKKTKLPVSWYFQ